MPFYLGGKKVSEETFSVKAPAATDVWVENCPNIKPASRAA